MYPSGTQHGYPSQGQQGYPPVGQVPSSDSPTVSTQGLNSRPSAPLYPRIDPTFGGASSLTQLLPQVPPVDSFG